MLFNILSFLQLIMNENKNVKKRKKREIEVYGAILAGPVTMADLARRLGLHRSTITWWINQLEREGLVKRIRVKRNFVLVVPF